MSDPRTLERELDRINNTTNVRIQFGQISSLIQAVSAYVKEIKDEEALVKRINEFKRVVHSDTESPEEEKASKDAATLLVRAREVERHIGEKKAALRHLEGDVQNLLQEIRKG